MPGPNPFPCGGPNQPACPPQPASGTTYTIDEMKQHGLANYNKGVTDTLLKKYKSSQGHIGSF